MEETDKKRFYIIDGNAYIYRSFHAIQNLSTSTGMPTNAIFGFINMIMKVLRDEKPDFIAVAFDTAAPTFRHKEFSGYKADRPGMPEDLISQFPTIKEILQILGISIVEHPGYEADDIIGTLAKKAEGADIDVTIVTSDKDAFQLVSDNIKIRPYGFRGIHDDDFIYNNSEVKNRYGVDPDKITDLLGLMGDTSDSIPGVPGIGPKTAAELLGQFESIDDLLERVESVKNERIRNLIKEYAEQAKLSKRLATIDQYVPISSQLNDFRLDVLQNGVPAKCDQRKLLELFQELEFRKFIKDLDLSAPEAEKSETRYYTILSESDLHELISRLENSSEFAIDTETDSIDPISAEIVGISVAIQPYEAFYIPLSHSYISAPAQLPINLVISMLKPVLENPSIAKIGQNIKYDYQVLRRYGVEIAGISFDTMIASYILNPSSRGHDLDSMAMTFLNHKMIPIEELIGKGKEQITMSEVEVEKVSLYSCEDADITLQLKKIIEPKLVELESVFKEIELPLIPVLADMEMIGVKIDVKWLNELSVKMSRQLDDLTREIYNLAGEEFNINSTQQLGDILFNKLKLPSGKKTKTGYSTNEAELERLSEAGYDLPSKVLQYRSTAKLKSTYVDALPANINPRTGRIHTSFNQAVTETGRLSSSNPNLQNIPIRTEEGKEIRKAFIPDNGKLLLTADYSQIELRMLAHLSKDSAMTEAFRKGEDIHSSTASLIFGLPIDQITPEMRRRAKTVNFGIIYGISAFRLSNDLGFSVSEAQNFIDSYFRTYSDVKSYFEELVSFARKNGYIATISGRQRRIPEINSTNKSQREFAERIAINTPVQGSAADLIKLAMIKIADFLRLRGLKANLLLQVHDELIFEVPEDELELVTSNVCNLMENAMTLDVPIKADFGIGKNWLDAK